MRAIMSLNDRIRWKNVNFKSINNGFERLKIQCRTKQNYPQDRSFREELLKTMKSVCFQKTKELRENEFILILISFRSMDIRVM